MPVPTRPISAPTEDDLPTIDDDGDGDGDGDAEGILGEGDPLESTEDDVAPEFDDESPTDPSFDFDLPSELELPEVDTPHDLPLGPEFAPREEDTSVTSDDAIGFGDALDRAGGADEVDAREEHDAGEGFEEEGIEVAEPDLPTLDGDDGPELDERTFGSRLESADDSLLPQPENPWRVEFLAPDREHCSALTAERGVVVTGSNDLFWLDAGRETVVRMGLDGTRISSLALAGVDGKIALAVTAFGRLLRRARSGGDAERLVDWRRVAEASGSSAEGLELRSLGAERPTSLLGRLTSGRLVRSDDLGSTFRMVDPSVTALAMTTTGQPVVVITRDGSRIGISSDGGSTWQHLELASPAREVASGEAPLVAADGRVVVLGDAARGVVVSADGGRTFRSVAGVSNVTALSAGAAGERPSAFAALYRVTDDRSLLVEIDAETGTANAIGMLSLPTPDDPDLALELGRVERLLFDGAKLWAAGAFGLARIQPPG